MLFDKSKIIKTENGYHWTKQNCPICFTPATKRIGRRGGEAHRQNLGIECEIWQCEKCEVMLADPMPFPVEGLAQHYNIDADSYFENQSVDVRAEAADNVLAKTEKVLGGKGRILDVGAGRGEMLRQAKKRGWEIYGIEPSDAFADYIERNLDVKIYRQPVEECDLPENSFDAVILASVLEHLYNPMEVIASISKLLRVGGVLYFDVPNEQGLYFKFGNAYQKMLGRDWSVNLSPTFSPYHIFGYSPKTVRLLLEKNGLESKILETYAGINELPKRQGLAGSLEAQATKLVTSLSNINGLGAYMESWATKC